MTRFYSRSMGQFMVIPPSELRDLAGAKVFARGEAYFAEGRVRLLSVDEIRVLASVTGTETYRAELRWRARVWSGTCDCPAYEDADFCKHLVAVGLAVGATGADQPSTRLRAHLVGKGADALADLLIDLAARDPALWKVLESEVGDAEDDDATLIARYGKVIDAATDVSDGIDYYGAGAVADEIEDVRARLEALATSGRLQPAFVLAERLVGNLQDVVEAADDSDGELHAVGAQVIALHARLCVQVGADPMALAETLLERVLDGVTDLFSDAVDDYAEALGTAGLAEFRRLARVAWDALPSPQKGVHDGERETLRWMLDRFAQADGDVDARIALLTGDLTQPGTYVRIADICLGAGQDAEALRWLEEALWCFEGLPNLDLEQKAAGLMMKAGRTDEAIKLLWKAFERSPTLRLYRDLKAGLASDAVAERVLEILRAAAGTSRRGYWNERAVLLLDVLVEEGRLDEAWTCVATHWIDGERLRQLAEAGATSHPGEAIAAYERLAETLIRTGGAPAYDQAVKYIRRRGEIARDAAGHARYVADLRLRHKAKRTFIPRLAAL